MKERKCDICGRIQDKTHEVKYNSKAKCYLCNKHKLQFLRYGKIIDATQRTTNDKNEIIIKEDHAEIIIRNRKQEIVQIALIDLDDVERCSEIKWHTKQGSYVMGHGKIPLHRFIMNYTGPLQIDHINRNKSDNRKQNLRIVTGFENAQNNGKLGVSFDKKINKWRTEFQRYGKYYNAGLYETKEDAIAARAKAIENIEQNKTQLMSDYNAKDPVHVVGVHPSPHGKWTARYCADNKVYHIGTFKTKEEAIEARESFIEKTKQKSA